MTGWGVVIVNYNCAPLALDAALSALGDDPEARIVIVDNGSTDGSLAYFEDVFDGAREHTPVAPETGPATVRFAALDRMAGRLIGPTGQATGPITILAAGENRGFAAGCNIGMRALKAASPARFLLLNPDALLASGALEAFAARLADDTAGLCGAACLRFDAPHCAQAFGGARLRPVTLQGENLGAGRALADAPPSAEIEAAMDYPLGAAMAFRADYRAAVGDLDERFFLYFEEADYARRGGARRPVWARAAVVYHRHGAAAGSREAPGRRGAFADYHMARSRLLYALKWRAGLTPLIVALTLAQSARRVWRGHLAQARAVFAAALMRRFDIAA